MKNVALVCAVFLACAVVATADVFQFIDSATGRCVDNGDGIQGRPLQLWNCVTNEGTAKNVGQRWSLVQAPKPYNRFYYIKDQATGMCLDNGADARGDKQPPVMWSCVSAASAAKNGQLWAVKCTSRPGYYRIIDISAGECLDNGTGANASPLVMWGCYRDEELAFTQGQLWHLKRTDIKVAK